MGIAARLFTDIFRRGSPARSVGRPAGKQIVVGAALEENAMAGAPPATASLSRRARSQPILETMQITALAERAPDRVFSPRSATPGYFLFGPPVRLMAGRYRLSIRIGAGAPLYPA